MAQCQEPNENFNRLGQRERSGCKYHWTVAGQPYFLCQWFGIFFVFFTTKKTMTESLTFLILEWLLTGLSPEILC